MKRRSFISVVAFAWFSALLSHSQTSPQGNRVGTTSTPLIMPKYIPTDGIVYYKNPVSGGMAFYLNYELEPDHSYLVEITSDAVNYQPLYVINTQGQADEIYHTYNVGNGLDPWPRFTDLGPNADAVKAAKTHKE